MEEAGSVEITSTTHDQVFDAVAYADATARAYAVPDASSTSTATAVTAGRLEVPDAPARMARRVLELALRLAVPQPPAAQADAIHRIHLLLNRPDVHWHWPVGGWLPEHA